MTDTVKVTCETCREMFWTKNEYERRCPKCRDDRWTSEPEAEFRATLDDLARRRHEQATRPDREDT